MSDSSERRQSHRIDANLQMELMLSLGDGTRRHIETINVSGAGVFFSSDHFIEPMTKLQMRFEVPLGDQELTAVECEGIVVRIDPDAPMADGEDRVDRYDVAVFFTTIDKPNRSRLERYIESRLHAS